MTNNLPRHLEGDTRPLGRTQHSYDVDLSGSSGPWKHTPQKLVKRKRIPNWWLPVAVVVGIAFWGWVLT